MLSDDELDELVRRSDTARTPIEAGLTARGLSVRDGILKQNHHKRRSRWRPAGIPRWRSLSLTLAIATLVAGGGTVAVASSGLETPWGWIADNVFTAKQPSGEVCFQGLRVDFAGQNAESEIVVQARSILAQLDLASLDISKAERELRDDGATNLDGTTGVLDMTANELRSAAVHQAAADVLFAELEARGFEPEEYAVSLSSRSNDCG